MPKTTHTLGPWVPNDARFVYGQCADDEGEAPFVADNHPETENYTARERANACLIAAAPDARGELPRHSSS